MTKTSYTLRVDRVLSFPGNDPIEPRAKKARQALAPRVNQYINIPVFILGDFCTTVQ